MDVVLNFGPPTIEAFESPLLPYQWDYYILPKVRFVTCNKQRNMPIVLLSRLFPHAVFISAGFAK